MKPKADHWKIKNKVWWICVTLVNCVEIVITKHMGNSLDEKLTKLKWVLVVLMLVMLLW